MKVVPQVKDGFILVPVGSAKKIADALRHLNEVQYTMQQGRSAYYRRVQFLAYCFEQAENMSEERKKGN